MNVQITYICTYNITIDCGTSWLYEPIFKLSSVILHILRRYVLRICISAIITYTYMQYCLVSKIYQIRKPTATFKIGCMSLSRTTHYSLGCRSFKAATLNNLTQPRVGRKANLLPHVASSMFPVQILSKLDVA